MIPLLLLIFAAAPRQLAVIDEIVHLEPKEVRGVNLSLLRDPAVIAVRYSVRGGAPGVAVSLIGPSDGTQAPPGTPNQYLRMVSGHGSGQFRFPARQLGEYQVVVDARKAVREMEIQLNVDLVFDALGTSRPARLSSRRRGVVVAASLAFFLAVCWWSSRKLFGALRRRPPAGPPSVFW